jgi:hypothetical protein
MDNLREIIVESIYLRYIFAIAHQADRDKGKCDYTAKSDMD